MGRWSTRFGETCIIANRGGIFENTRRRSRVGEQNHLSKIPFKPRFVVVPKRDNRARTISSPSFQFERPSERPRCTPIRGPRSSLTGGNRRREKGEEGHEDGMSRYRVSYAHRGPPLPPPRIWGFSPLPFINGGRGAGRKNSRGGEKEGRKEGRKEG